MLRRFLVLALLPLVYAAPAYSLTQVAPPGNSAVQQYLETVPGAGGAGALPRVSRTGPSPLSSRVSVLLNAAGPDGQAAAALAAQTAPPAVPVHAGANPAGTGGAVSVSPPAAAVGRALLGEHGGTSLGLILPLVLAGALLGAILLRLRRRRRDAGLTD